MVLETWLDLFGSSDPAAGVANLEPIDEMEFVRKGRASRRPIRRAARSSSSMAGSYWAVPNEPHSAVFSFTLPHERRRLPIDDLPDAA